MDQTKAVVSVAEMARMVGLSRARFHQLTGTTFPWPVYDVASRRPFYTEELQAVCLEVRRRNFGIDRKPVLFYTRRAATTVTPRKPRAARPAADDRHADLLDGLKGLGLTSTSATQVAEVLKKLYPQGTAGVLDGEVLRAVFLHLKRQVRADNVQR